VGYEPQPTERGERLIWLEAAMVDRLGGDAMAGRELQRRQPGGFVKVDLRPSGKGFRGG
jgi:hypothetical protein